MTDPEDKAPKDLDGIEHFKGDGCVLSNCPECGGKGVHMQGIHGGYLSWCEICGWEGP